MINLFGAWKPKGKMYSFKCSQCGLGFLSSYYLEAPICGKCLQKTKSLDSTVDYDKSCKKSAIVELFIVKSVSFMLLRIQKELSSGRIAYLLQPMFLSFCILAIDKRAISITRINARYNYVIQFSK
jgi:hypothetical protein